MAIYIYRTAYSSRFLYRFDIRYRPWMGLPSARPEELRHPLDLIACTIAARHLDPMSQKTIAPRLARLTEETLLNQTFLASPSTDAVLGLLLMSLWAPINSRSSSSSEDEERVKIRSPIMLSASATHMALNLGLGSSNAQRVEEGGNASIEVVHQSRLVSPLIPSLSSTLIENVYLTLYT